MRRSRIVPLTWDLCSPLMTGIWSRQDLAAQTRWPNWLFSILRVLLFPINLYFPLYNWALPDPAFLPTGCRSEAGKLRTCWVPTTQRALANLWEQGRTADARACRSQLQRKETSPDGANSTAWALCCNIIWKSHQAAQRKWQVNWINWCYWYAPDHYPASAVNGKNKKPPTKPLIQAFCKRN